MTDSPSRPGEATSLAPDLVRVLAPNPSPMTGRGTNSYVLGTTDLVVIDPGPDDPDHLAALRRVIADRPVSHILVTHAHVDHSAGAPALSRATGAPVLGFGDALAGRSPAMRRLAAEGFAGGGEGRDEGFRPDRNLPDGAEVSGDGWSLRALHTPGHFGNHLCFVGEAFGFSGDLVMGWASTLISPPDGDLTDFLESCARLRACTPPVLHPGHGDPVTDPRGRIDWLVAHRAERRAQIVAALAAGPATAADLAAAIYAELDLALLPAAERNVFAHLVDLVRSGLAEARPTIAPDARFALLPPP